MINNGQRRTYDQLRRKGWRAVDAFRQADAAEELRWSEDIRIRFAPDDFGQTVEELAGEGASDADLDAVCRAVERNGVFGVVGEYLHPEGDWVPAASVWGFCMDEDADERTNSYVPGILDATKAELQSVRERMMLDAVEATWNRT